MSQKVAIVTGASRGIGRAIARSLAEKDYIVIANYNKSEDEAKKLKIESTNIDIFKADVSKREQVKELINYTIKKYGKIDVLVNLYSVFCVTQETIKNMIQNKSGCIINISSIYGTNGGACATAYSATKAGIDGITKSLAKELGPSNIRVNSIAPGCINTDMNKFLSEEDLNEIKNETPLQKIGEGIDIARCVEWLVEDKFTTGQVISINGGWQI